MTLRFNFEFNSSNLDAASMNNMRLSLFRADVIRQYLINRGVEPSRIESHGKGLTEPLNDNKTEEQRALNRRVKLLIYYQE